VACWLVQTGLWSVSLAMLYRLTSRPAFSCINLPLLWLPIVLVSNSKEDRAMDCRYEPSTEALR
jgi:hypothetical protein